MKELNEQLKEIIYRELSKAFEMGLKQHPNDADNSEFYLPLFDLTISPRAANEITALINDNYYDKKFTEWVGSQEMFFETRYQYRGDDGYRRWFREIGKRGRVKYLTTDELFEHWKTIRDKCHE